MPLCFQASPDDVRWEFGDYTLRLTVANLRPGKLLKFDVKRLYGDIVPDECKGRVLPNKVVLTLRKVTDGPLAKAKWNGLF